MKDGDFYDKITLHLERLNQGLDLLAQQACRDGEPLPEGFWFIFNGLERASKKLRRSLDRWRDEKHPTGRPGPRLVDQGDGT